LPPVTAKLVVNGTGKSGDRSADAVVDEIRRASGQAVAMIGSVTDRGWVGSMVAEVVARWDRVDILVNNAGFVIDRSFVKLDLEDFEAVLNVHLMGAVNCTRAV
jgi:NAD(P)-dependent dehydrogenase (short-subunit alcohol dehydrogenase family)